MQAELEKEVMYPAKTLQSDDNDSGCGSLCPSGTTYLAKQPTLLAAATLTKTQTEPRR